MSQRVSIVIPVHNGGRHLVDAVRSALDQDYRDLEVVVVDNASTDSCTSPCEEITDARLRIERFEALVPADENWTRAVGLASGNFIKLLCADDALLPGCISRQVAAFSSTPGVGLVAARRRIVRESGEVIRARWGLGKLTGVTPGHAAIRACVASGANLLGEPAAVMFRAEALRATMPWSPTAGYTIDVELYLRVLQDWDLNAQDEVLALFRVSTGSWSSSVARTQARDFSRTIDEVRQRCPDAVSATDARKGKAKALARQWMRGVVYLSERISA